MALLPSFRRLMSQNFEKQYQNLINTLSLSLNNGIQVLYDALNNGLTFQDNFEATIADVTLQVDSTGKPIQGGTFTLTFTSNVEGVFVIMVTNVNNPTTYPTGAVQVFGQQSSQTYIINNVTGLQPNTSYKIRIVALGS
jgi:hypothetical protein